MLPPDRYKQLNRLLSTSDYHRTPRLDACDTSTGRLNPVEPPLSKADALHSARQAAVSRRLDFVDRLADRCDDGLDQFVTPLQATTLPYHLTTHTESDRIERMYGDCLPPLAAGRVLDWGCSRGITTVELQRRYPSCDIVGIDVHCEKILAARSAEELRVASAAGPTKSIDFRVADGYTLDEQFDAVFCNNNISYVFQRVLDGLCASSARPVIRSILSAVTQLVADNGYLAIAGHRMNRPMQYDFVIFRRDGDQFIIHDERFSDDGSSAEMRDVIQANMPGPP
jgi:SAM-dependent methyltransferase